MTSNDVYAQIRDGVRPRYYVGIARNNITAFDLAAGPDAQTVLSRTELATSTLDSLFIALDPTRLESTQLAK